MYINYEEFKKNVYENAKELVKEYPQLRLGQAVFNHITDLQYTIDDENITVLVMNEGTDCFYDNAKIEPFIRKCYEKLSI